MNTINVAIIGVSGYTGLELIKILLTHPHFRITYIANSSGDTKLTDLHPSLSKVFQTDVMEAKIDDIISSAQLVFLALPHKTAMPFVKELISNGLKVVDLSADYRLSLETYEEHYCPHIDQDNIVNSVYGLPEFFKKQIAKTDLVANPGCYPTATLLAILPFIDYIEEDSQIFIDAKSGVSGAGKKLSDTTHFVTINENIFAYNPFGHRHSPEIAEKISILKDKNCNINFIPHLLPLTRGMLISIYVTIKEDKEDIKPLDILRDYYKDEYYIRISSKPVDVKSVSGTNFCDIFAKTHKKALFINSSIDNLLRGASSQAVVNANIMYGFDETTAIPNIAYVP
jgi:N-acetyl-gamma-glutamyl-phosphate reductase